MRMIPTAFAPSAIVTANMLPIANVRDAVGMEENTLQPAAANVAITMAASMRSTVLTTIGEHTDEH